MDKHDRHIALSAPQPPQPPHQATGFTGRLFLFRVNLTGACMWPNDVVAHAPGAAWRRRQRRLRAHWRHEQLSLQMLLATYDHHAAARGQSRARSGEEARDVLHGRVPVAPPSQGSRPPCLGEARGPQARIQQRTMEQLADVVPLVQILDPPVPQMVEQLPDVLRFLATLLPVPEQVIEVPKIVLDDAPVHTSVRDTQLLVAADCGAAHIPVPRSGSSRFSSQTEFNSDAFLQETHF